MRIKVRLNRYLSDHQITPFRLARQLLGTVSQMTVYSLCKADEVQRIDLSTLAGVLHALRQITGEPVQIKDLLEEVSDQGVSPVVQALLTAPPARWEDLCGAPEPNDSADDAFWSEYRSEQRRLERLPLESSIPTSACLLSPSFRSVFTD